MIDAYASRPHFLDHVIAVWAALPADLKGDLMVPNRALEARGASHGARRAAFAEHNTRPLLVASHEDLDAASRRRPIIYLEHGSGQSYQGDARASVHPAYSGGRNRGQVILFLVPNEIAAARNRVAYPETPNAVIGCPRLDGHVPVDAGVPSERYPTLGITWHWDCFLCPETRSAWPAWKAMLRQIADVWPGPVLGHAHPRLYPKLVDVYKHVGIEPVDEASDFLEQVDVVAFDNTSLGYEAAALGTPTVVLNAPWYRRDIEHGLRFWDLLPGPDLDPAGDGTDDAEGLACAAMLAGQAHWRDHAQMVAAQVYPPDTRGRSARLAVDAVARVSAGL